MRVLIAAPALDAHFNGCVPLAWALRTAGHEVRVASQPPLTAGITSAGLTAVPVGSDPELARVMATAGPRIYAHHQGLDLMGSADRPVSADFLRTSGELLTEAFYSRINSEETVDDLVAFCRAWRPDLVLWETFTFAGALAAHVTGTPHARLLWGPDLFLQMRRTLLAHHERDGVDAARTPEADPVRHWLTGHLARYDRPFTEEVVQGQWRVDQMPASMRLAPGQPTVTMRYVPYNGPVPAVVPDWLRTAPERPRVCLTKGLSVRTIDSPDGRAVTTEDFFEAVAGLDAEVVAILDDAERDRLTSVPDNTRVVDHVPLHALMPTCAALVHHGGAGTWSTAAVHGVPQIVLASMWDNVHRARRTEEVGAGLSLPPGGLTPAGLRTALERLLTEPAFKAGAEALRQEMLAEPSPNDVVPELERLAALHRA
ncbi:activator-dependent family glycosyltransferase [Streptomyces huiliensis]|uniref:activator-dependent family glycosyltransferase n=1 Tax=Streptomyces huiliensis TaxID=2876027 RepID=UPI001CBF2578|nr:activator-dependent family glycosyltransferase [Streptomyces huiliensis]MBZ4319373.1 activator-dependent family glycosyltransferase [Streptomyces huiliensis]